MSAAVLGTAVEVQAGGAASARSHAASPGLIGIFERPRRPTRRPTARALGCAARDVSRSLADDWLQSPRSGDLISPGSSRSGSERSMSRDAMDAAAHGAGLGLAR